MLIIRKHPLAEQDLYDCWLYIATENSPSVADNVLRKIESTLNVLASNPDIGKERLELEVNLFSFPSTGYSLFYTYNKNHLNLIRVLHGTMDAAKHIS